MKCVVTGGCGFIGSHLVDALVARGDEVAALDDFSTGDRAFANPAATLVEGSVTDAALLRDALRGADAVFHAAALASVPLSVEDPAGAHAVNATGTLNVLQAARDGGVGRVVFSSSSSVYGEQDVPVMREDMTPRPLSPYGLQKLIGEQYGAMFARLFGMRVVSLRYFNVYGPRQPAGGAYALVVPQFLRLRDEGRPLTVYGDGCQTRSYVHVDDVVRANLLAADANLPAGEHLVLNVGSDEETSVNEIAARVGGAVEHVIPNPRGAFEEGRKCADPARAKALIGWEPRIPFAEGIGSVLEPAAG